MVVDMVDDGARLPRVAAGGGKRAKKRRRRGGRVCASLMYSCAMVTEFMEERAH